MGVAASSSKVGGVRAERGESPICFAPFASLYLDPLGDVRACCQNRWQVLGNVRDRSLRDIWRGSEAEALRDHLRRGDLGLGCELCQVELSMGSEQTVYLRQFDSLRNSGPAPDWPKQLELALSISCNLQCIMCNGDLSSSIRIHREHRPALASAYSDGFFEELDSFLPHLERVTFLGGEPFLGAEPLRVMSRLLELGLRPACHVTTNGTVWNSRVERVLTQLPMHVAVSIDGATAATVESIRIGVDFDVLCANIDHYRRAVAVSGGGLSLAFCLMRPNWHELGEALAWADRLDVDMYVNSVTHPPALSLHHADRTELDVIVAAMELEDERRSSSLGRNLGVWNSQLEVVRHLRDHRGTTVASLSAVEHARRIAVHRADSRGVQTVDIDARQVVQAIAPDPSDFLGLDVRAVLGEPSSTLMAPLAIRFGALSDSQVKMHGDGVEERHMRFGVDDARTEVVAAMAPTAAGGQRWFVAARSARPAEGDGDR